MVRVALTGGIATGKSTVNAMLANPSVRVVDADALAREVVGGNGITLATDVARFHADAEAVYSYEGTHEINALVVARAATGLSAFNR